MSSEMRMGSEMKMRNEDEHVELRVEANRRGGRSDDEDGQRGRA